MLPRPKELNLLRFSIYPMFRAVMESSGQTAWVLGPETQRDRVLRLLQILKDELIYDGRTIDVQTEAFDDDPSDMRAQLQAVRRDGAPKRRMRLQWLRETAAGLGIDEAEFAQGIPGGYLSLLREVGAEQGVDGPWRGRSCAGGWMFVSGLSHPSFHRSLGSSINKSEEVDGQYVVWTRPDPRFAFRMLKAVINIHITAMRLFHQAFTAPTAADDDS